jgi:hypothetical protein
VTVVKSAQAPNLKTELILSFISVSLLCLLDCAPPRITAVAARHGPPTCTFPRRCSGRLARWIDVEDGVGRFLRPSSLAHSLVHVSSPRCHLLRWFPVLSGRLSVPVSCSLLQISSFLTSACLLVSNIASFSVVCNTANVGAACQPWSDLLEGRAYIQ